MPDICTYYIRLRGQVEESEINRMSPLQMTLEPDASSTDLLSADKRSVEEASGQGAMLFTVCTDQAGVVGLMRHLHGLGLVLLSIRRGTRG